AVARVRRRVFPQHHEALGVVERQRPEERGVDEAEDCGVGADPEREDGDAQRGEGGCLPQRAEREAKVLRQVAHSGLDAGPMRTVSLPAAWESRRVRRASGYLPTRLYLRMAANSASCEIASVRCPSTPVIVSAATSALMIASSVASTVASKTGVD